MCGAVITTKANGPMMSIHDRTPVVIDPARLDTWIDSFADLSAAKLMLAPAPDGWLIAERASMLVNDVRNEGPELLNT